MPSHISCTLPLLGLLIMGAGGTPLPRADDPNLRESCRKVVGGDFLSTYDEMQRTLQLVQRLTDKQKTLAKALQQAEAARQKAEQGLGPAEYDTGKLKAIDDAKAKLALVSNNLRETKDALVAAEKAQTTSAAKHAELKKFMAPVFNIEKRQVDTQDTYPWEVAYKSTCPKFRAQCPLSDEQKPALRELATKLSNPEPCRRYASGLERP